MALFFRHLIGFFHNFFFLHKFSIQYTTDEHTPASRFGALIIFAPVIGAMLVTWIIKNFAPEAKGHGVPEIIYAIRCKNGILRPIIVIAKAMASAITIGSGGSVGREGPIAQICSGIGSTFGQLFKLSNEQRVILVAAGASAGIAATFNAPLGALAFSIELMLTDISAVSLMSVSVAVITATYLGRMLMSLTPAFHIPALAIPVLQLRNPIILVSFALLGIIFGFASALFIKLLYWCEDRFQKLPCNDYLRHVIGMLMVGMMMYAFMQYSGHYYVDGVGYASIMDILQGLLNNYWFLILLFVTKLIATCITIGSGGSGGIFSPSLFLGATLGAALGGLLDYLLPGLNVSPIVFAIAGMAAMVSGTTGASVTAIVMTFEMTRDYNAILPIMLSASIAYFVRLCLLSHSIYTLKLSRRGIIIQQGLRTLDVNQS